jgi:hypothetical protein
MFKKILSILILIALNIAIWINFSFAENALDSRVNTNYNWNSVGSVTNDHLNNIKNNSDNTFYGIWTGWAKWIKNSIIQIAKDVKNIAFALATIYFLIITIRQLFSDKSEEEFDNYKKWVIWITIWIVVMQIAYYFVIVIYDKWAWAVMADSLLLNIVKPIIKLLETMASIFFLWIALYSFIRLISAWWNEESIKKWKSAIIYALLWMALVKLAAKIIETIYWRYICNVSFLWVQSCWIEKVWTLSWFSKLFLDLINWLSWFVAIITVLIIIYAWVLILFSAWDDEKIKRWKNIIIYAFVWILVLAASYLILTFFIWTAWSNIK